MHLIGGVDPVLRNKPVRHQPEHRVNAARDLRTRGYSRCTSKSTTVRHSRFLRAIQRSAIEVKISKRMRCIGKIHLPRCRRPGTMTAPGRHDPESGPAIHPRLRSFRPVCPEPASCNTTPVCVFSARCRCRNRRFPVFIGSVARQRCWPPPPHSSVNNTFLSALLKLAECQKGIIRTACRSDADGIHRVGYIE